MKTIGDFKEEQLGKTRVKNAYEEKESDLKQAIESLGINYETTSIYMRAFKSEGELEVYISDDSRDDHVLLKTYSFCMLSGVLGPKRREGDYQVPEGFYHVDRFNPYSNFHLSLGINYPNEADLATTEFEYPGGDIFIHGNCVSIGCIPITDDKIKELYVLAVEAKDNGMNNIPVHIFPFRFTEENNQRFNQSYADQPELLAFWQTLAPAYHSFEESAIIPFVKTDDKGAYYMD